MATVENNGSFACSLATVVQTRGALATVEVDRRSACENCQEQGACGLTLGTENRHTVSLVDNSLGAHEGDMVEVSMDDGVVLWGAFVVYMVPLAGLIAGVLLAEYLNTSRGLGFSPAGIDSAGGVLGLVLGLALVRLVSVRWKYLTAGRPRITRVVVRGGQA